MKKVAASKAKARLPEEGDVYAAPLESGGFGAIRVLRVMTINGDVSALVSVTPWRGMHLPTGVESSLQQTLATSDGMGGRRLALCWYDGPVHASLVWIARLPVSEEERGLDARGTYGGRWNSRMAFKVERVDARRERSHVVSALLAESPAQPPARPSESEREVFWADVARLDWTVADPELVIEPLIANLARRDRVEIESFEAALTWFLFQLDGERFAREIGSGAYGTEYFSPDHFLDARCAAVARGQEVYSEILATPSKMPKDAEFEALLWVAERAWLRRFSSLEGFSTNKAIFTFSNRDGWAED
jgi:hypothetical protein